MSRAVWLIIGALVAAGCGDGGRMPAAPSAPALTGPATSLEGVVEAATGSAHKIRPLPDGELFVLTFSAVKRTDGTTTGYAHVDRKDLDIAFDVDVTCLSVVGNTAWIGGIIRNARGGLARDGTISYFYVIDNGEGSDAPPDRTSTIRFNDRAGEDIAFCDKSAPASCGNRHRSRYCAGEVRHADAPFDLAGAFLQARSDARLGPP